MPALHLEPWLTLGLIWLFIALLLKLGDFPSWRSIPQSIKHRTTRPLRPRTPDDCPFCRETSSSPANSRTVIPYAQLKSPRGPLREKTIDTQGYACPHIDCKYGGITDAAVHALIAYGHHGQLEPIQDLYCQACRRKFSARRHTPLYRLKASSARVAQALLAVAEGLSTRAAARVFSTSETTLRSWLARAGQHSRSQHERFLRGLHLAHVQLDEIRLKLHGTAEAKWLWIASDTCTALARSASAGVLAPS